jgi:hypothetical protein
LVALDSLVANEESRCAKRKANPSRGGDAKLGGSSRKRVSPAIKQPVAGAVMNKRVTGAAQRLRELKATGVELYEILGSRAGVNFIRDYCDGDPEVAYAAIALVYSPRTPGHSVGEQGEAEGSKKNAIYA